MSKYFLILILFLFATPVYGARLFSSGAELQQIQGFMEFDSGTLGSITGPISTSTTIYRSGAASYRINPSTQSTRFITYATPSTGRIAYARVYMYVASRPTAQEDMFYLLTSNTGLYRDGAMLRQNTDGTLELWTASSTAAVQIGSDSPVLSLNTWYKIDLYLNATSTSAWEADARIDGVSFASTTSISVPNYGNSLVLGFGLPVAGYANTGTGTYAVYYDDIAINDENGSNENSFPPEGKQVYLRPNGDGDGNGCASGDYSSVDDNPNPDDAGTYCELDADSGGDILDVAVEDTSTYGINSYDTISLVQVGVRGAPISSSAATWNLRVKSAASGTVQSGTATTHNDTTYKTNGDNAPHHYTLTSYTDPTTSTAWTPTGTNSLDSMQIGINCTDCNPNYRASALWALVEYNVGTPPVSGSTPPFIIWYNEDE